MDAAGRSLIVATAAALALGCGRTEPDQALPEQLGPAPQIEGERPSPAGEPTLYDEQGRLLESDQRVAGLVLPRGLEPRLEERRRHVYLSTVPIDKMQQYFGVRLVTGEVEPRPGGGVTYRNAVPRDVRGAAVSLDVTVEPSSAARTRVEVVESEPAPQSPPSEAEQIERLRGALERAD